jgi:hypothetical protein
LQSTYLLCHQLQKFHNFSREGCEDSCHSSQNLVDKVQTYWCFPSFVRFEARKVFSNRKQNIATCCVRLVECFVTGDDNCVELASGRSCVHGSKRYGSKRFACKVRVRLLPGGPSDQLSSSASHNGATVPIVRAWLSLHSPSSNSKRDHFCNFGSLR